MYKVNPPRHPSNRAARATRSWIEQAPLRNVVNEHETDDYETYGYEYKSQMRLKPRNSKSHSLPKHVDQRTTKRNSLYLSPKHKFGTPGGEEFRTEKTNFHPVVEEELPHFENDYYQQQRRSWIKKHEAAITIQSAFRGYSARKKYWKRKERFRRLTDIESLHHPPIRREYVYNVTAEYPKVKMEEGRVVDIPPNADPHLGTLGYLERIDPAEKENLEKSGRGYTDPLIPPTNDLQDEQYSVVLLMGGINPRERNKFHLHACSVYVYIVEKDKWFFGGTMQEPRCYHGAAVSNGKVYVTGGLSPCITSNGQMVATPTVFQLNVRGKRWRPRANMHHARAHHGICEANNSIFVFGGKDDEERLLQTVEVYDTVQDKWTMIKSLPKPMMSMAATVLDQVVYLIGGLTYDLGRYQPSTAVYTFDIMNPGWSLKCNLPEPLAFCSATTMRREIWLWGGTIDKLSPDGHLQSSNKVYTLRNLADSRWELAKDTLSIPKHSMAVAKTMGRKVFLLGGMSSDTREALNENDIFDRETITLFDGASLPYAMTGAAAVSLPPDNSAKCLRRWGGHDVPEDVKECAATKIQARFRGHRTRSILDKCYVPQQAYQTLTGDTYEQMRHNKQSLKFTTASKIHDDFRKFKTVSIAEWPPILDPTSPNSDINIAFNTQPPGYTIGEKDHRSQVKRYIILRLDCDPNLGAVQNIEDSMKRTKKSVGLRRMEPMPYSHLEVKGDNVIKDDCIPIILLIGGLNVKEPTNYAFGRSVLKYNPLKNNWTYIGVMPEPRNHHAAVYMEGVVYVTGGLDPDLRNSGEMVATRTLYAMNVSVGEWIRKSSMIATRAFHSLVAYQGKLYAIGGRDNNGRLIASIECYDPKTDKWTLMRPMSSARLGVACVVYEDKIWCLGGVGTNNGDSGGAHLNVLSIVQSYDPSNDSWTNRPPLRCPRAFGFCLNVNKKMWLCAGCCRIKDQETLISMASVDCYNEHEAAWERCTIISNPRHCCAVTATDDCIYLFGGMSSQEWSAQTHNEMIITTDRSLHNCADLSYPLTGLAAVTIPPHSPSLRAASLSFLLHYNLTR